MLADHPRTFDFLMALCAKRTKAKRSAQLSARLADPEFRKKLGEGMSKSATFALSRSIRMRGGSLPAEHEPKYSALRAKRIPAKEAYQMVLAEISGGKARVRNARRRRRGSQQQQSTHSADSASTNLDR